MYSSNVKMNRPVDSPPTRRVKTYHAKSSLFSCLKTQCAQLDTQCTRLEPRYSKRSSIVDRVANFEFHCSCERNLCNCVKKPEKNSGLNGFEPVTLRYRCDALTKIIDRGSRSIVASYVQMHKLLSQLQGSFFISFRSRSLYMIYFIYIICWTYSVFRMVGIAFRSFSS